MSDLVPLVDRLAEASVEAKSLIRDLHAATKDARAAIREIAAERDRVESMVRRSVEAEIEQTVEAELAQVAAGCKSVLDAASHRVLREFGKLGRAIFTGGVKRRDGHDLRDMVR